jgi:hypothetical protein
MYAAAQPVAVPAAAQPVVVPAAVAIPTPQPAVGGSDAPVQTPLSAQPNAAAQQPAVQVPLPGAAPAAGNPYVGLPNNAVPMNPLGGMPYQSAPPAPPKKKSKVWIVILIVVIVLVLCCGGCIGISLWASSQGLLSTSTSYSNTVNGVTNGALVNNSDITVTATGAVSDSGAYVMLPVSIKNNSSSHTVWVEVDSVTVNGQSEPNAYIDDDDINPGQSLSGDLYFPSFNRASQISDVQGTITVVDSNTFEIIDSYTFSYDD